jgi:DUF971 family protein
MSHEGIRFVSPDEAASAQTEWNKLPQAAMTPVAIRVDKTGGTGMQIDWQDGHKSAWNFAWLRNACPCATCKEERDAAGRKPGVAKQAPKLLLPMYEAPARPTEVKPVGRYAINFKWNDGHESGIYSWDFLRRNCLCAECAPKTS